MQFASEVARGVQLAQLDTGVPVIFCVLTCDTLEQAIDRAGLKSGNKGYDAGLAALEMANLSKQLRSAAGASDSTRAGKSRNTRETPLNDAAPEIPRVRPANALSMGNGKTGPD